MKRVFIYLILILIAFFLSGNPYLIYAGSIYDKVTKHDPNCPYANVSLGSGEVKEPEVKHRENLKAEAELEEQMKKEEKQEIESFAKHSRLIYEKLAKRTKECKDVLDSEFFTINSHARKAIEAKDFRSEKEFITLLSDYNSVLGDLGLMQVILDMGKFAEGEKFLDYYDLMESGYERLKDSFSLKNEIFLKRIDELKNQNVLRYTKRLSRDYKEYFQYDPRLERIAEPEVNKGDKK
jgi:hypothetical protein